MMEKMKFIQVQWTAAHLDEAREISGLLLSNKLVACCSIIPLVESWFEWQGEIQQESEVKVLMKTVANHFQKIEKVIRKNHSYEVPEIIAFEVIDGMDKYLSWIEKTVQSKR